MTKSIIIDRIGWIDWAKSFCMFLVILGHCHFQESGMIVIQLIYSFHMLLFFFLSGYLCQRQLSLQSFLKDFRYIIIPYLSFGTINIIIGTISRQAICFDTIIKQLHTLFIGLDGKIGAIWFLPSLFICKQMFLIIKSIKKYSNSLYYICFIISFAPAYFFSTYQYNTPFFSDSALCGLPFFFMGHESRRLIIASNSKKFSKRILLVFCLCVISYYLSLKNGFVSIVDCMLGKSIVLYYINGTTAIIAILLACSISKKTNSFIIATSYGTIFTLWASGIFLSIFNYYLPLLINFLPTSYSVITGFIYSTLTYIGCYATIRLLDRHFPIPFGLKGNLSTILNQKNDNNL